MLPCAVFRNQKASVEGEGDKNKRRRGGDEEDEQK